MKNRYQLPVTAATLLLLGIMLINTVTAAPSTLLSKPAPLDASNTVQQLFEASHPTTRLSTISTPTYAMASVVAMEQASPPEVPPEVEELRGRLPATFNDAKAQITSPSNRFLLWTHDLQHVLWGHYQRHVFIGWDNLGRLAWGLYGKGYFVGRYDGAFFWGRYLEGRWKAIDLFDEDATWGRYLVAPGLDATQLTSLEPQDRVAPKETPQANAAAIDTTSFEAPDDVLTTLRARLPKTLADAEATIHPPRNRFLLWTQDLTHVMWGRYGSGYFVGTDNQWNHAWGLYGDHLFAGLYDGDFFIGRYGCGHWCARHLFGEPGSQGRYLVHPNPTTDTAIEP